MGGGLPCSFCHSNPFNQRFISIHRHLVVYITPPRPLSSTPTHTHTPNQWQSTQRGPASLSTREERRGQKVGEGEANGRVRVRAVDKCAQNSGTPSEERRSPQPGEQNVDVRRTKAKGEAGSVLRDCEFAITALLGKSSPCARRVPLRGGTLFYFLSNYTRHIDAIGVGSCQPEVGNKRASYERLWAPRGPKQVIWWNNRCSY